MNLICTLSSVLFNYLTFSIHILMMILFKGLVHRKTQKLSLTLNTNIKKNYEQAHYQDKNKNKS